jgi:hypothetical protein
LTFDATLGSVDVPHSVRGRFSFWVKLHERLAKLENQINGDAQAKILGSIHARIPMLRPDEQRSPQMENAKADEMFWNTVRDIDTEQIEGHEALIRSAEKTVAARQAAIIAADNLLAVAVTVRQLVFFRNSLLASTK